MRKYCDLHLKLENEKEIFEAAKLIKEMGFKAVSYTHLRAHETRHDLVCRLLLEKKKHLLH